MRNHTFKLQIILDRHIARQKLNYCLLPDPPLFSLLSTYKGTDWPNFYSLSLIFKWNLKFYSAYCPNLSNGLCLFPSTVYCLTTNRWMDRGNMYILHRHRNVEIGTEAALFPEKEYIKGIFFAVH
jgi:hypothetical protein